MQLYTWPKCVAHLYLEDVPGGKVGVPDGLKDLGHLCRWLSLHLQPVLQME